MSTDRVLTGACAVLLLAGCATALALPTASWFVFDRALVLASFAVVLALAAGHQRTRARRDGRVLPGVVVGTSLAAAQVALTRSPYGWDAGRVRGLAVDAATGHPWDTDQLAYLARYPNNLPLVRLEQVVVRVGAALHVPADGALIAAQVGLVAVVLAGCGAAVRRWAGAALVLPAQVALVVLLGLSPALGTPYSDLPAAAAVAGSLGLAAGRWWRWALAGLVLGLGVALKPFVLALALGALVGWRGRGGRAGCALAAALACAVGVGGVLAATGADRAMLAAHGRALPPEHFLAMGTYDSGDRSPTARYGAYREAQVQASGRLAPDEQRDVLRLQVARQVASAGPDFFARKAAWVWGDGTFWAQGEGTDARTATPAARALRPGWASAVQGLWLALLAVTGAGLLRGRDGRVAVALAVTLLVHTTYLLAFEARPRYLLPFLPVVVVLAAIGWDRPTGRTRRH